MAWLTNIYNLFKKPRRESIISQKGKSNTNNKDKGNVNERLLRQNLQNQNNLPDINCKLIPAGASILQTSVTPPKKKFTMFHYCTSKKKEENSMVNLIKKLDNNATIILTVEDNTPKLSQATGYYDYFSRMDIEPQQAQQDTTKTKEELIEELIIKLVDNSKSAATVAASTAAVSASTAAAAASTAAAAASIAAVAASTSSTTLGAVGIQEILQNIKLLVQHDEINLKQELRNIKQNLLAETAKVDQLKRYILDHNLRLPEGFDAPTNYRRREDVAAAATPSTGTSTCCSTT